MQFLRRTIAAFIILNTLGTTLAVPLIYLDFGLRKEYISKVLCIKRDKPITICGGHCYLSANLKKAKEAEQKGPKSSQTQFQLISFFFSESAVIIPSDGWVGLKKSVSTYQAHRSNSHPVINPRPPQVS